MIERHDVPLAPLTTLGVGGVAQQYYEVYSAEEVAALHQRAPEPWHILGGGSNLLVADIGVTTPVIRFTAAACGYTSDGAIWADAACSWDMLVQYAVHHQFAGIECLSGIPGMVGAAPIQNIGAYGQQFSDVCMSIDVFDRKHGILTSLSLEECHFGYRSSIFNADEAGRYFVLRVHLQLKPGIPVHAKREEILTTREQKGMLRMAGRKQYQSAGSFFKNPMVTSDQLPPEAPTWPQPDGTIKTSAAWLIEQAGIEKGMRCGGAMVSPDHALSLINAGNATADDIITLAQKIREQVHKTWDILLQPEVQRWGFASDPLT